MHTPIIWGEPETSYSHRFMYGVDKVVTDEMQSRVGWVKRQRTHQKNPFGQPHRALLHLTLLTFSLRSSRPLR